MSREPITHTPGGAAFRRPITPASPRDDLFQCALVLDREPSFDASRAQLVALIWPEAAGAADAADRGRVSLSGLLLGALISVLLWAAVILTIRALSR